MTDGEPFWKTRLREQFETVLASLDESEFGDDELAPLNADGEEAGDEAAPDLYAFYETLTTFRHEIRQGNRKTAEVLSRFGESLETFNTALDRLKPLSTAERTDGGDPPPGDLQKLLLPLIELADRIHRLERSFEEAPEDSSWWAKRACEAWRTAWNGRASAANMLADHVAGVLRAAGLRGIPVEGASFDPRTMTAVAREVRATTGEDDLVVVEEITRGYRHGDKVVRLAEVRVGSRSGSSSPHSLSQTTS